jgi:hypothetical protein
LRTRGYYLGSNVSYNLKKLVEMGFLDHQRSRIDRRSVRIKLTEKGRELREIVDGLYQKHVRTVEQVGGINPDEFSTLNKSLHAWSGSGPIRSCIGCKRLASAACRGFFLFVVLRRGDALRRACGLALGNGCAIAGRFEHGSVVLTVFTRPQSALKLDSACSPQHAGGRTKP